MPAKGVARESLWIDSATWASAFSNMFSAIRTSTSFVVSKQQYSSVSNGRPSGHRLDLFPGLPAIQSDSLGRREKCGLAVGLCSGVFNWRR